MKKVLKWLVGIVAVPILLFLILTMLLYCPSVQNWAARRVASYASEKTGMEISVGRVGLSFPLDLQIDSLRALRVNDSIAHRTDTVADVARLVAKVQLLPLMDGDIEVDELTFSGLHANTTNFIGDLRIRARLDRLHLESHAIHTVGDSIRINVADIRGGWLDIALGDTVPDDTTKERPLWKIDIDRLQLAQTDLHFHLPGDTMSVKARFGNAVARRTRLLLHDNIYSIGSLDWQKGAFDYNLNYEPHARRGFDAAHIAMTDVNVGLDSFLYAAPRIYLHMRTANLREKSGLAIDDLRGPLLLDSTRLSLSSLYLKMPGTELSGRFDMDLNAFADSHPGRFSVRADGHVSKSDLRPFLTSLPQRVYAAVPSVPLTVQGRLEGNLQYAAFRSLRLAMPRHFDFTATGWASGMTGHCSFRSDLRMAGRADDLRFVARLLPRSVARTIAIPRGIGLNLNLRLRPERYSGRVRLSEGGGTAVASGFYDTATEAYRLQLRANALRLGHFLPRQPLRPFTGRIALEGRGTDFLSPRSSLRMSARIDRFQYGSYVLDGIRGNISMNHGKTLARVNSTNPMLGGSFTYSGRLTDRLVDGHLRGWLHRVDLRRLGIMTDPYVVSAWADLDVRTDMKDRHYASGLLRQFRLHSETHRGRRQLLAGTFNLRATVNGRNIDSHLRGRLSDAGLQALGLVDKNYHLAADADLDFRSNSSTYYNIAGHIGSLALSERRGKDIIPLVEGDFDIDAAMKGKAVGGRFDGSVARADLYQLGMTSQPFTPRFTASLNFSADGADDLMVRGLVGGLTVATRQREYAPGDVSIDILSRRDTTHAVVDGGDFHLNTDLAGSYRAALSAGEKLYADLTAQIANKRIDQSALRRRLPTGHLVLRSGEGNLFSHLLAEQGYIFRSADLDLSCSPSGGINGSARIDSLVSSDNVRIDSMRMQLATHSDQLVYDIAVLNGPANEYPYRGYLKGTFYEHGIRSDVSILDQYDRAGVALSLQAAMADKGIRMGITSDKAVLGYKEFSVNDSNYVYIGRDRRLSADMRLLADDGAGVQLSTEDADTTSLQNFTVSMNRFELGKLLAMLPFAPNMQGTLNGDYHVVQTAEDMTVSSDMTIRNFVYENCPMGNVGTQLVYMPKEDGTHYVDGIITQDDREVGSLTGTYSSEGRGRLDAVLDMDRLPLGYVNGFVPDQLVGLRGYGEGSLSVKGPLDQLDINGEVYLDSSYIVSVPYGVEMRFANDPVLIRNSRIEFENFEMFANNDSPLNLAGYLDFANPARMQMDVRMRARNFQLIDARENPRSEVYGKAFVDFDGRMSGLLSNLRLTGQLDVLGNTDMTYVMRDGTLTTDSELKDLVRFTQLNDSTPDIVARPDLTGFSMALSIGIDEQAHIICSLNADHSNYIDLFGGGSLLLSYDPANSVQLRGRYTLSNGEMKYSLPVIPLRTFTIHDGSYLEFTGDPMQPILSIVATEEVKTSVSEGLGEGRLVGFQCGVALSKRFPKPGVEFIINAPDDQEMQNTLNTKSTEERSKLAVTMLASGMYFDATNTSSTNTAMNGALASFLQSQVNNITGKALNTMGLDITANMESAADVNGSLHTDYTFKFSKRLWDNRLRINMGARVSTGSNYSQENGAYFDNFSLEYRMNKKETKYLKLYYEREAYDYLEGSLSEFGAGFMWKRKLAHFRDIFRFRSRQPLAVPADSTKR
ncbi:translocation/assembly module TamB domain-containing protein [Prevotella dentasini]